MQRKSKDELVAEAEAVGVETEGLTKEELERELEGHDTPALGPAAPEGQEPEGFEQVGEITGVQPLEDDDIPEAGR